MFKKLGKCLKNALLLIDTDPSLRLVKGPPGQDGDTAHFWVIDNNNKIIDPTPEAVGKGYSYKGNVVDHKKIRKELNILEWSKNINKIN